jgi:hypothetical protein
MAHSSFLFVLQPAKFRAERGRAARVERFICSSGPAMIRRRQRSWRFESHRLQIGHHLSSKQMCCGASRRQRPQTKWTGKVPSVAWTPIRSWSETSRRRSNAGQELGENQAENFAILQIFNKTKRVNLVSLSCASDKQAKLRRHGSAGAPTSVISGVGLFRYAS